MLKRNEKSIIQERELLSRIADKDEHAFLSIYESYHKKIYTFALRFLKSKQLAEEVVQESFLKIWLLGEALNSVANIEAYLVTLSRNKSLDLLRQQQRELVLDRKRDLNWAEGHNNTEETIILNDTRNLLQSAIDLLPPQQKLVYQLCHQQGMKYDEAAEKLNLSPLTVKTHMQHALRFLRKYMAKNGDIAILMVLLKII